MSNNPADEIIGSLKREVVDYIKDYGNVSFVELERKFPNHFSGDYSFRAKKDNVYFWTNMTKQMVTIIGDLVKEEIIEFSPTSFMTYLIDGKILQMDVAKKPPKGGYKTPRWLPVVMNKKKKKKELGNGIK